jgi:hypothetical protein
MMVVNTVYPELLLSQILSVSDSKVQPLGLLTLCRSLYCTVYVFMTLLSPILWVLISAVCDCRLSCVLRKSYVQFCPTCNVLQVNGHA